jgi:hypothetical protein
MLQRQGLSGGRNGDRSDRSSVDRTLFDRQIDLAGKWLTHKSESGDKSPQSKEDAFAQNQGRRLSDRTQLKSLDLAGRRLRDPLGTRLNESLCNGEIAS